MFNSLGGHLLVLDCFYLTFECILGHNFEFEVKGKGKDKILFKCDLKSFKHYIELLEYNINA